jgi:hypothetical protein
VLAALFVAPESVDARDLPLTVTQERRDLGGAHHSNSTQRSPRSSALAGTLSQDVAAATNRV